MSEPGPVMATPDEERRRRNNIRLALVHVAPALGFLAWFVWAQVQRG
jgi:hypothetical protein